MYFHRALKVFLSKYVDDLKMAGISESLPTVWAMLQGEIAIDPLRAMVDNQYLGCSQRAISPAGVDIERMSACFENFSVERGDNLARAAHPELIKDYHDTKFNIADKVEHVLDEEHSAPIEGVMLTIAAANVKSRIPQKQKRTSSGIVKVSVDPTKGQMEPERPPY